MKKEKPEEKNERLVCGVPESEVRSAFFKGKIPKLLLDIQAKTDVTADDLELLKAYLTTLKKKGEALVGDMKEFMPSDEEMETIPDELLTENLTPEENATLAREEHNRDFAVTEAQKIMRSVFDRINSSVQANPSEEELMDFAFKLLALQYYIGKDEIYKERLFRKKITEYEMLGKQRKTAEEFAKISKEYREWRLIQKLEERVNEFILLVKKRYKTI